MIRTLFSPYLHKTQVINIVKIPVISDTETILTTSPQDTRHRHREWDTHDSSQKRGITSFLLTEITATGHRLVSSTSIITHSHIHRPYTRCLIHSISTLISILLGLPIFTHPLSYILYCIHFTLLIHYIYISFHLAYPTTFTLPSSFL